MVSLEKIEADLTQALKARDRIAADTLRGLKVRIQNDKIAKMRDLSEEESVALVKSEIKRRKEAAESFGAAGRSESAEKELSEAAILERYLPAQMTEEQVSSLIDSLIAEHGFAAADFGKAMAAAKAAAGQTADGAQMAKLLKEKLK